MKYRAVMCTMGAPAVLAGLTIMLASCGAPCLEFTLSGPRCGGEHPLSQPIIVDGTYALVTVDGAPLPALIAQTSLSTTEAVADTIVLAYLFRNPVKDDSLIYTWVKMGHLRVSPAGGAPTLVTTVDSGTALLGTGRLGGFPLVFTSSAASADSAFWDGHTLSFSGTPRRVYTKP